MTASPRATNQVAPSRRGYLALLFQETLTAVARVQGNRQVAADATSFRAHLKHLLATADADARSTGYTAEDVKSGLYACIVFLDEAVLNSSQAMFAGWHGRSLQEEVFGGNVGGEAFFHQLRELQSRQDSEDLADVLEVFQLCLLLGFHGRYRAGDQGELLGFTRSVGERIARIRGPFGLFAPAGVPQPGEVAPRSGDPWLRRLGLLTAGVLAAVLLVLVIGQVWLGSHVATVGAIAQGVATP